MLEPVTLRWIRLLRLLWPASLAVVAGVVLVVGLWRERSPSQSPAAPTPTPTPALLGAISIRVYAVSAACEAGEGDACSREAEPSADAGTPSLALAGARVRIFQVRGQEIALWAERVSDARGRASVPAAPGSYWLLADAPGRARRSARLVLDAMNAESALGLPSAEPLAVTVRDAAGQPIAGATVLVRGDDELPHGALTSAAGLARLEHVGRRVESVRVSAPGHDSAVISPSSREVLVALSAPAALEVDVRDAAGQPARDAEVWVSGIDIWPPRQLRAGPDGVARIEGLSRGTYDLRARLGDQVSAAAPGVTLERGQRARASLSLGPGRFIVIQVRAAEGDGTAPVSGADVTLVEDGLSPFPLASRTAADGAVTLGPVPPSSAMINVRADGFVPESAQVPRLSDAPIRVLLMRGGQVSGRVVDVEGRPIEGARLEVVGNDLEGRPIARTSSALDAPGGFFERSLEPPRPLVPMGELGVLSGPLPLPGRPPAPAAKASAWVSDLDGYYRVDDVPPGKLRVLARHPDFMELLSEPVTLGSGGSAHVQLVLERGASLRGRVLDPLGRPVARARVELLSRAAQSSVVTGSDGFFAFRAVPTRFDLLLARPEERGRFALRQSIALAPAEAREIELVLPAERPALTVAVRAEDGQPLSGASVALLSLDPSVPLRQSVESDPRGECSLLDVVGIPATLRVEVPGFRSFEAELDAVPARVEVTLSRGLRVSGRITQAGGREGVRGAELVLVQEGQRRSARSDERGNYEISGALLGPASLELRHPDFSPETWDVSITPGDREGRAAPLEPIELDEPGVASGRVLDPSGRPVRGARVGVGLVPAFVPAGARLPGFVETDERGHFQLKGLEPGRQTLSAYAAGVGRGSLDGVVIASRERTTGLEIRLLPTHTESEPAAANVAVTLGERGADAELEVVIVNVAANSEAERAGVRQGDVLWSVDHQAVTAMKDARAMLGGSAGSDVILELEREGETTFVRVRREAVR